MKDSTIKLGIVGMGKMGLLHASIFNTIPGVEVTAICEAKPLLTHFAGKAFPNIKIVNSTQEFSGLKLDAVVVSTPIPSHISVISTLYSLGITNIFTEKTLAANGAESLKLCELANKADGISMAGYMARFATPFQKAKELLALGVLGQILSFQGYAYSSDFIGIPEKSYLRGGVLRDLGCHVIDMAMWYFGELTLLDAVVDPKLPVNGESSAKFHVACSGQLQGEFDVSWCREDHRVPDYGLVIKGSKGFVAVNNDSVKLNLAGKEQTWYRADMNDSVPFLLGAAEYYREDLAFVNALTKHKQAAPDFIEASKVDSFIDLVKIGAGVQ